MKDIKLVTIDTLNEVMEITLLFDNVFLPPLSDRIKDIKEYATKLFEKAIVIAIKKDDNIIGFSAVYVNDNESEIAYLAQIAILPEWQNCGIGQMLLTEGKKISIENGMRKLRLEVYSSNFRAISFYKKNGFVNEGIMENKDYIYMMKIL